MDVRPVRIGSVPARKGTRLKADLNLIIAVIFSAGGGMFLRSIMEAFRGWRADDRLDEESTIRRLVRRNALVETERDRMFEERNVALEVAQLYRGLALRYGATEEEVNRVASAWSKPQASIPARKHSRRRSAETKE